ncbi:MAG TPA: PKD domain-containing protein, partial [Flavobacteriales bacterium]|nr:PKD domain-containing protein [Flavobacteriales bacterium]
TFAVTNGCGNSDTATVQIEVIDNASFPSMQLDVYFSPACPNESIFFYAPGGYLSYVWDAGDGSPADSTPNSNIGFVYSDTGTYYLTCKIYDYCGNDTTLVDTVVIGDNVGFIAGNVGPINVKSPICPGELQYISAPYDYMAYVFDYGDGTPQDSSGQSQFGHTYNTIGTYYVSVTVYNYCGFDTTLFDSVVVTNNAGFQNGISIGVNPLHCPGEEVDMYTYGGHAAYVWTFGDGSPQDSNDYGGSGHIYADTGTYGISVTITNYCGIDTTIYDTVIIDDNVPFPNNMDLYGYPNPVCPNDDVSLNTNYGYLNYSWDFGNGYTVQSGNDYARSSYDSVGTYQAYVTITNGCGLDTTLTTGILVDTNVPFPIQIGLYASSPVSCPGDIITFSVGDNFALFFWDFGGDDTLTTTNSEMSFTYDSAGTYTMSVTVFNGCGNQTTLNKTVLIDSLNTVVEADIFTLNNTVCPGDAISIGPNGENGTSYTYYWDFGDGNVDTTYGFGTLHSYADTGTYIVNVIAVNGCGFSATSALTIYVLDNAMPSLGNNNDFYGVAGGDGPAGCAGDAVIFYFAGLYDNVWDFGDGSSATATNTITVGFGEFSIITHAYQDTGSYWATLTITNGCGNSFTDSLQVVIGGGLAVDGQIFAEPPTTGSYTTCEGITFLAMGGNSYDIDYGDGTTLTTASSTTTHFFSVPGTYTVSVTITNSCGNSATESVSVTVIDGGGATVNSAVTGSITCAGGSDGSVGSAASGGSLPYTYSWNDPSSQSTQIATGLSAGIYTVTITDANGCSGTSNVGLADAPTIAGTGSTVPAGCGSSDGSITVTGLTGGTGPYTFLWENGDNTNTADSLASGTHSVTITDANSCVAVEAITLSDSGGVNISAVTVTNTSCNGGSDGAIDITSTGGTAPYSYLWSNGDTIEDISGIMAGTYTVTVTDASGCKTIQSGPVGEPDAIAISSAIVDANCGVADGSIVITVSGGTPAYSYNWSTGNTTSANLSLVAGAYTVTVTDDNGCTGNFTITVSNANAPVITAVVTDISCNGAGDGMIDLTVTGGTTPYNYLWLHDGSFTQDVSGLSAGNITVILNDGGGCQTAQTYTIVDPEVITASSTTTGNHCGYSDGTAMATAAGGTGAYTYSWSSGGSSSTETGMSAGGETVTVTDANSCSVVDSVTIVTVVDEQPICIITVDSSSTRNVIVWEKPSPPLGIESFNIYREILSVYTLVGNVPYLSLSEFTDTTNSVNPNTTSYRYKVSAVDSCTNEGAQSEYHETIHMTVNLGIPPAINLIWDNYEGFTFTNYHILRDSMGLGNWDTLASLSSSSTTYTDANSPQTSGLRYQIVVIAPSVCLAEKAKSYNSSKSNTTSANNPQALGGSTSVTNENQPLCDGTATAAPTGGIQPYTYAWSTTPAQTNATATGLCSGNYTVLVADDNGDTITLNATVGVVPGIAESGNVTLIHVFPNPNRGNFTVNFTLAEKESAEIKIYDLQGRLIESRKLGKIQGTHVEEVDIARYGSGLYYVQLKTETGINIKKIILE